MLTSGTQQSLSFFSKKINSNMAKASTEFILGLPSSSTASRSELPIASAEVSKSATGRPKRRASSRISDLIAAEAELRKYPLGYGRSSRFDVENQPEKPHRDHTVAESGSAFPFENLGLTPSKKNDDEYPCCYCEAAFPRLEELEQHILTHVRPLPYVCAICEHSFSARQTLLIHMARHVNQRRHACPICPMAFTQNAKLKLHLRTHSGERPYKCSFEGCKYAAAQKGNLNVHLRSVHGRLRANL